MALTPSNTLSPQDKRARREAAQQDELLREVDEAVRQSDVEAFMRRYGKLLLAVVVIALLAFAGWIYWRHTEQQKDERQSEELVGALDQLQAGNLKTADDRAAALAKDGEGLAAINARLMQAGIAEKQGRKEEAAKGFAAVADDASAPKEIRDLAKIRVVNIRYDTMKPADVIAQLKGLAAPGGAFFPSAAELVANAYLDQGNKAEAGALFAKIAQDDNAPESLRSRSRQMAGMLGVDAVGNVDELLKQQGVTQDATQGEDAGGADAAAPQT